MGGHFEFCGQLVRGLELRNIRGIYGDSRKTLERSERCRVIASFPGVQIVETAQSDEAPGTGYFGIFLFHSQPRSQGAFSYGEVSREEVVTDGPLEKLFGGGGGRAIFEPQEFFIKFLV